jgi:hypothetical protein
MIPSVEDIHLSRLFSKDFPEYVDSGFIAIFLNMKLYSDLETENRKT